ncbi:MAG: HDOD domain-containing protein [Myxococcota bacterium]
MRGELAVLGELLQLAEDPNLSLATFAERVAAAPKLAGEILRVANSALYGMAGRISRLERAVLILGQTTVTQIATTVLVAEQTRSLEIGPIRGPALWLHCLESAYGAAAIARALETAEPAEAHLAGLLHDLGIPDLFESYGDRYARVVTRATAEGAPLEELERETFGETHAERILQRAGEWGFPARIRLALGCHHAPLDGPEDSRALASMIVAAHSLVADDPAGWSEPGGVGAGSDWLEELGLLPAEVQEVREVTRERLKEAQATYG